MSEDLNLKHRIHEDMKQALRKKEPLRLTTLRMLLAAIKQHEIKQREINKEVALGDSEILQVIRKMIKQRHDAAEQFEKANRNELAEKEKKEIVILEHYLPSPLAPDVVEAAVKKAITDTGASSLKDMSKVMALLKPQLEGRTDMRLLSEKIKQLLAS